MAGKKDKISDDNRYSILVPNLESCFVCGTKKGVALHEVYYGTANRAKSKEYGMVCPLCQEHHQGNFGVHFNKDLDLYLKRESEKIWLEHYYQELSYEDRIEKFIKIFGQNYLK